MVRKDKQLGEGTYSILIPSVRSAMVLCSKVSVLVGSMLGGLKGGLKDGDGLQKFSSILAQIDPVKVDAILMEAVSVSHLSYNEKPISGDVAFERHFQERRGELYPVLFWTLWECVKDFFPMLGGNIQENLVKVAKEAFQSQMDGSSNTGSVVPSGQASATGLTT